MDRTGENGIDTPEARLSKLERGSFVILESTVRGQFTSKDGPMTDVWPESAPFHGIVWEYGGRTGDRAVFTPLFNTATPGVPSWVMHSGGNLRNTPYAYAQFPSFETEVHHLHEITLVAAPREVQLYETRLAVKGEFCVLAAQLHQERAFLDSVTSSVYATRWGLTKARLLREQEVAQAGFVRFEEEVRFLQHESELCAAHQAVLAERHIQMEACRDTVANRSRRRLRLETLTDRRKKRAQELTKSLPKTLKRLASVATNFRSTADTHGATADVAYLKRWGAMLRESNYAEARKLLQQIGWI